MSEILGLEKPNNSFTFSETVSLASICDTHVNEFKNTWLICLSV